MRTLLLLSVAFIALSAEAKTLSIKLPKIGSGKTVYVSTNIEIPSAHKINTMAGSNITVFEKQNGNWTQIATFDLNPAYGSDSKFSYSNMAKTLSPDSELKVTASLFHCPKAQKSGPCVIDDYEGLVKRSKDLASTEMKFSLKGTNP